MVVPLTLLPVEDLKSSLSDPLNVLHGLVHPSSSDFLPLKQSLGSALVHLRTPRVLLVGACYYYYCSCKRLPIWAVAKRAHPALIQLVKGRSTLCRVLLSSWEEIYCSFNRIGCWRIYLLVPNGGALPIAFLEVTTLLNSKTENQMWCTGLPSACEWVTFSAGGMFELVSCPHYFAEIIIYLGIALLAGWYRPLVYVMLCWVVSWLRVEVFCFNHSLVAILILSRQPPPGGELDTGCWDDPEVVQAALQDISSQAQSSDTMGILTFGC